ncbi:MAG: hypothetical protein II589_09240 [Clostridia bacterium]|nr:hypothetical protein [Clostridia bacterium]
MQEDFHYYATYCAAILAGYTHEQSMDICYSAQLVDMCSRTFLIKIKAPLSAATTQLQLEMMDARTDPVGLQDITRIWVSFHFLPADLNAKVRKGAGRLYKSKYRLICNTNSELLVNTVTLANGNGLQAAGIAMHILADTWAHRYFAGTPSLVINNTNYYFYEQIANENGEYKDIPISFRHSTSVPDDLENHKYTNSLFQSSESSIMNLGHGRAGHLPDYSFIRYKYLPAWGDYEEIIKDNPSDFYHAFCQMIYAMQYLHGDISKFMINTYAWNTAKPYEDEIKAIIKKRQLNAAADWKAFGERLSGKEIEPFDLSKYESEYIDAEKDNKNETFLGKFILAAMAQKSMVTNKIFLSGNLLAGYSIDFNEKGFAGIKDYKMLVEYLQQHRTKTT